MHRDEASLLRAWGAGEREAGEQLFSRYYRPLTRFFVNKVRTRDEVEDLVQRTFVSALEGAPRFRGESSVRTWLFAIARNLLRQFYDRRRRESVIDSEVVSVADFDGPGPSTLLRGKAEQRLLLRALRRLPLETQILLELFYWEEMRSKEIGEVLGVPAATARGQLAKARRDLGDLIAGLGEDAALRESTIENLEDWARGLRQVWGV